MSAPSSMRLLYYGRDEDLPTQRTLHAGPLSAILELGDLREIRWQNKTLIRRIYMAVRDRNWGTVAPQFTRMEISESSGGFDVAFEAVHIQGEIDFTWAGTIHGETSGEITYTLDGVARTSFWRNRIGFCVLYPAELAGASAEVTHTDGSREPAIFPQGIVPQQPVLPFSDVRAMRFAAIPGLSVEMLFEGDVFEMEDQRNWTDASFKFFCTPLSLPYPAFIKAGTQICQKVSLSLQPAPGFRLGKSNGEKAEELLVEARAEEQRCPMPLIGLGMATHGQSLSSLEMERIRAINPAHLRVDLRASDPAWEKTLEQAIAQALALDAGLEIAMTVGEGHQPWLQEVAGLLTRSRARVAAWLCYPEKEMFGGGSPVEAAVRVCRSILPTFDAPLYAGTNADLIFLLRSMPPRELVDGVCFAINPQVHAFDNISMIETLAAQAMAVESACSAASGLPVAVSPVTLKPRFNAYASGPIPFTPPGELPSAVDPRQLSLFMAGWTVGSLAALAGAGAARLTLFETTGWQGIMETEAGSRLPEHFPSLAGQVFPVYHVLADAGEFAGGEVFSVRCSHPFRLSALGLACGQRRRVLIASHAPFRQVVTVSEISEAVTIRWLDETCAKSALGAPEDYRKTAACPLTAPDGTLRLEFQPYAIACIDILGTP